MLLPAQMLVVPLRLPVGKLEFVKTTSSKLSVQTPLGKVHLKVALVPTGTPVIVLVSEEGVVMEAVPPIRVQVPVPVVGVFPARVNEPLAHLP